MMKISTIMIAYLLAVGCATPTTNPNTIVLHYRDFGPQVAAHKVIGMEWWQWDNNGDPDPKGQYDIKVVVHQDIPLHQVRKSFPVVKEEKQDYRYLSYAKAMAYLDDTIQEDILPELTDRLKLTRSIIEKELGKPARPQEGAVSGGMY